MEDSMMNIALRQFDIAEANLLKAERLLAKISSAIPSGVSFGSDPEYEQNCAFFVEVFGALPKIDGWKPEIVLFDLNEIAQNRLDAQEIAEIEAVVAVETMLEEPDKKLRDYRFQFTKKRRALVREALASLIDQVNEELRPFGKGDFPEDFDSDDILRTFFSGFSEHISQIDVLLGSTVARPTRWNDLWRHIHFGKEGDLSDIISLDWPAVKSDLQKSFYNENEPIPSVVEDLGDLVRSHPNGPVAVQLKWETISAEEFERLIFSLISYEPGYENPEWLMKTNAADRGRDISVNRVHYDSLGGTIRSRTIIQCKHWLSTSIGLGEITVLKEQMKLWEPPRVDLHVIATSGRFTADGVQWIERHNQSDSGLRIEMWAESHLERLLALRPALIAEFRLR